MTFRYGRIAGLVGLGLALGAGLAQAQGNLNARLNGEYAFSQSRSCVEVAGTLSFDPRTFQIVSSGPSASFLGRHSSADRGTVQYNGDGTGSANVLVTFIQGQGGVGSFPVNQSDVNCALIYKVNPDGTVDQNAACSFTTVFGFGVGSTGTVTGIRSVRRITQGNRVLLHGPSEPPVIETVTIPGNPFPVRERVCVRSGTSIKVSGRKDDD